MTPKTARLPEPCHLNAAEKFWPIESRGGGQAEVLAGDRRSAIKSAQQPLPAVIGGIAGCEGRADARALERAQRQQLEPEPLTTTVDGYDWPLGPTASLFAAIISIAFYVSHFRSG